MNFLYTGSKPGQLNWRDRTKAAFKGGMVIVTTALAVCAEQIQQVLPMIRQNSPLWLAILVGTFAGVVIYFNEANKEKKADNRPPEEK